MKRQSAVLSWCGLHLLEETPMSLPDQLKEKALGNLCHLRTWWWNEEDARQYKHDWSRQTMYTTKFGRRVKIPSKIAIKFYGQLYNFTPVCMVAIPPHKSVQAPPSTFLPVANPASLIIWANVGWGGNLRIDSTRYWYESRSPANMVPKSGMTVNEYWLYNLINTWGKQRTCVDRVKVKRTCWAVGC